MTRIAIAAASIVPGDAVGHDILHMGRILSERGHEVELFCGHRGGPDIRGPNDVPLRDFLADDPSAVLILHHAIGWPAGVSLLTEVNCRRVVRYHNVTPARFYDPLCPAYAELCRLGRRQLHQLIRANCDLYLCDSPFNRDDLLASGADSARCVVTPPFNDIEHLARMTPDPTVLADYGDGRTNLLFVGRRAPNKGHRWLIDAFAVYHRRFDPQSRLLLVGKGDRATADYGRALRQQVQRLGLQGSVMFLDGATEAELRAFYAMAAVFVLASEHEGFCVPLVEAMALHVPIVAYGTTATPDTLGDAGLFWEDPDPFLLAQSIACLVRDPELRHRLRARGRQRYQRRFANSRIERIFLNALRPLLSRQPGWKARTLQETASPA